MKINRIAILLVVGLLNIIKLASMQSLSLDYMLRTRKVPTRIFGNVRCPILRIKTNITLQCWCGLATSERYIEQKQTELETENK